MLACRFASLAFALLLFIALAARCPAAVFERDWKTPGDGLLTYDDVSQREWLDLTETQLFKFPGDTLEEQYQAVVIETLPGGEFSGFNLVSQVEVEAFAQSAGIVTSTLDFATNQVGADRLISLLGDPIIGFGAGNKWAPGYLIDGVIPPPLTVEHLPSGRTFATAGLQLNNIFRAGGGVWLYRPVPEPTGFVVILIGLAVLHSGKSRRQSTRVPTP